MIGITGHAIYLPRHRIEREKIAAAHGMPPVLKGERTAIGIDEDALTLALEAVQGLGLSACGGIYFASTTAPYLERMNAAILAAACDLPEEIAVADFAHSLRAGTVALLAAVDRVAAGGTAPLVVVAADARDAPPESPEEQWFGDGAAAVTVGRQDVVAEVKAWASVSDDFLDFVRRDKDERITSFASRFTVEGYTRIVGRAIARVLDDSGLRPSEIARVILPPADPKTMGRTATELGFSAEQLQETFLEQVGMIGCATPLLLLSAALEQARPGDRILLVGYGSGADAVLLEVTPRIKDYVVRDPIAAQLRRGLRFPSYERFRKAREYFRHHEDGPVLSNIFYEKEETRTIRLRGTECGECGLRQFPPTFICQGCRSTTGLREVPLGRRGEVFTYTVDWLAASPMPPTVLAVVDVEGGGRLYLQMTDVEPSEVRIGMPVRLTLRRLGVGGGLYHYYWKCRPEGGSDG
ncbi:MAG: OB-fold domain-containing protein [Blastocatellia bacterium]|nr:OB-fold domain-containing protein [Blastocatellia bacterium]MCS7156108.1 OB-fold domain-containing protein [Blastocatellia bacterium]MDW8169255.1 OB-fold domain-containing protein [Acidobacteriota bacterium]MDW8256114.1 OB-fold domain-containing protein [Acidobacteriota bacterium]